MGDYNRSLKEIVNVELQRELVVLEDQEGGVNCKFGVIYALKTQYSDMQMFSNGLGFCFKIHKRIEGPWRVGIEARWGWFVNNLFL